jgi:hypothetical protein
VFLGEKDGLDTSEEVNLIVSAIRPKLLGDLAYDVPNDVAVEMRLDSRGPFGSLDEFFCFNAPVR